MLKDAHSASFSFITFLADAEPSLSKLQVITYKEALKARYARSLSAHQS